LSRRALQAFDVDEETPQALIPDQRETEIKAFTVVNDEVFGVLNEVFAGTSLMSDQRKVKLLLKLRTDVSVAWSHTRDAFLEIGRALNDVDRELDETERDNFKRGFRKLFPFSETVASQFRAIARVVDTGQIPREAIPGSYGAAYQMALLTPEQRDLARERGLIRPDVSRDALIAFRQASITISKQSRGVDVPRMQAELTRLERQERRATVALEALRLRIREIQSLLGNGDDGL